MFTIHGRSPRARIREVDSVVRREKRGSAAQTIRVTVGNTSIHKTQRYRVGGKGSAGVMGDEAVHKKKCAAKLSAPGNTNICKTWILHPAQPATQAGKGSVLVKGGAAAHEKMCCRAVHVGEYESMQDTQMTWVRSLTEFHAAPSKHAMAFTRAVTRDHWIRPVLGLSAVSIRSRWCEYNLNPVSESG